MKHVIVLALFIFLGCASPQQRLLELEKSESAQDEKIVEESNEHVLKLPGPDGTEHLFIRCYRPVLCYKLSTKTCGTYDIIHTFSNVSGDGSKESMTMATDFSLLVKCKK